MFVEGIENIVATQKRVALHYFEDGSIESACPPLKALLHIMAHGHYNGKSLNDPEIRSTFTREYLFGSDWYEERLKTKQSRETLLWKRHIQSLKSFIEKEHHADVVQKLNLHEKLKKSQEELEKAQSPDYFKSLRGTLGADPLHKQIPASRRHLVTAGK